MKKTKYRMCLVLIFKAFGVILSDSQNTHITCITLVTCTNFKIYKIFFMHFFFLMYKNDK